MVKAFYTMNVVDANEEAGTPGAIQFFANVNSLNTFLGDVRAFAPYYALNGKSFTPDIDVSVAGIDIHLNQVNITDVTIGDSSMAFVGDTDTVRTVLTNMNITLAVDAGAKKKPMIPLEITQVFLQNVTIQLDMGTTTEDELKW